MQEEMNRVREERGYRFFTDAQYLRYIHARKILKEKLRPMREACDDAGRLTEDDYKLRVNY